MSREEIIHAYRHLYRNLLRAVQYSKPARFTARDRLREAFRAPPAAAPAALSQAGSVGVGVGVGVGGGVGGFDPEAIRRTIWFLKAAAAERGLEHRILRNLLRTAYARVEAERRARGPWRTLYKQESERKKVPSEEEEHIKRTQYRHYEMTVAMLNETMGLCLR